MAKDLFKGKDPNEISDRGRGHSKGNRKTYQYVSRADLAGVNDLLEC
jgi:hypothetical protein